MNVRLRAWLTMLIRVVSNGSIILLHVMYGVNQEARAALPLMIDSLQNAGYSFVTLSELLALN